MEENSNGSTYGKFVFISNKMKVCLTNSIGPKSLSDIAMNGTASSIFIPIIVYIAVYTCFMLTCIESYACCRLFFIITLHHVHVLYMLNDCDNQTCMLKLSHYSCYLALTFYQLINDFLHHYFV